MSEHKERADQLRQEASKRREHAIDAAMKTAEASYSLLAMQMDPYAMHKAVESIPTEILIDILSRKTRGTIGASQ